MNASNIYILGIYLTSTNKFYKKYNIDNSDSSIQLFLSSRVNEMQCYCYEKREKAHSNEKDTLKHVTS